jgi:hypothetical protein
MFKNFKDGMSDLAWTLGGTGLVLITLSGDTQKWGIRISVLSLLLYGIGLALKKED